MMGRVSRGGCVLVRVCGSLLFLLLLNRTVLAETLLVPADHDTIQEAIDAAEDGDVILVDPGLYVENIDFSGKSIDLRSTDGPDDTTINGSDTTLGDDLTAVVHFIDGEDDEAFLDGFSLVDGPGGGVRCDGSSPTILNCIIDGNEGPGVEILDGSPFIGSCVISDNFTPLGAGIDATGDSSPKIVDCLFTDNDSILGTVILWAPLDECSTDPVVFEHCTFENNSGGIAAGVIVALNEVVLDGCEFIDNEAAFGGTLVIACAARIVDCWFEGNEGLVGAAILHAPEDDGVLEIENTVFWNNAASFRGGVYLNVGTTEVTFDRCTLVGNTALDGGSVLAFGTSITTLTEATFRDCILWDNGDDLFVEADATVTIDYSDVEGGHDGTGNIDEDPLFEDADAGDFTLTARSPCRDAGDPDSPTDADGSRADMGATEVKAGVRDEPFELPPLPVVGYTRGDANGDGVTRPLTDALFLLFWGFVGGDEPLCDDAADADDSGTVNGFMDPAYLLHWGFGGGFPPPAPGPYQCGLDRSDDSIDCEVRPDCR